MKWGALPCKEVALALGISPNQAKGLLASARRRMRAGHHHVPAEQTFVSCAREELVARGDG